VTACGGDVSGAWGIDGECFTILAPFSEPACSGAVTASTFDASGTATFTPTATDGSQGSLQIQGALKFEIDETYSAACLVALQLGGPSPAACMGLQTYFQGPYSVQCQPSQNACECVFSDSEEQPQTYAYSVMGSQLVLANSSTLDFCQAGSSLVLTSTGSSSVSRLSMHRLEGGS
jgi:hypothetical protein